MNKINLLCWNSKSKKNKIKLNTRSKTTRIKVHFWQVKNKIQKQFILRWCIFFASFSEFIMLLIGIYLFCVNSYWIKLHIIKVLRFINLLCTNQCPRTIVIIIFNLKKNTVLIMDMFCHTWKTFTAQYGLLTCM